MSSVILDGHLRVDANGNHLTFLTADLKISVPLNAKDVKLNGPSIPMVPIMGNSGDVTSFLMMKGDESIELIDKATDAVLFKAINVKKEGEEAVSGQLLSEALRATPFLGVPDPRIKIEDGTEPPPYSIVAPTMQPECIDLTNSDDETQTMAMSPEKATTSKITRSASKLNATTKPMTKQPKFVNPNRTKLLDALSSCPTPPKQKTSSPLSKRSAASTKGEPPTSLSTLIVAQTSRKRKAPARKPAPSRRAAKVPKIWNQAFGDDDYTDSGGEESGHTDDDYDSYDDGDGFVNDGRVEKDGDDEEDDLFVP